MNTVCKTCQSREEFREVIAKGCPCGATYKDFRIDTFSNTAWYHVRSLCCRCVTVFAQYEEKDGKVVLPKTQTSDFTITATRELPDGTILSCPRVCTEHQVHDDALFDFCKITAEHLRGYPMDHTYEWAVHLLFKCRRHELVTAYGPELEKCE